MAKKSNDGLLIFDEDSPLFVKKKTRTKKRTRKTKSKVSNEIIQIEESKQNQSKSKGGNITHITPKNGKGFVVSGTPDIKNNRKLKNKNTLKNVIKNPADCKHILAVFKKKLEKAWKTLETGNILKATEVVNYLRGVAIVAKIKRPKEYEELMALMRAAKRIIEKRNRS